MKTKLMVLFVAVSALLVGGCADSSQVRMQQVQAVLAEAQEVKEQADERIDAVSQQVEFLRLQLADANLPEQWVAEAEQIIGKALEMKAKYEVEAERAEKIIATAQQNIEAIAANPDADIWDEVEAWGKVAQGVGPQLPSAMSGWVSLVGALAVAIGGAFGGAKVQKTNSNNVTKDIIKSVDSVRKAAKSGPIDKDAIDGVLSNQDIKTKKAVKKLKAEML